MSNTHYAVVAFSGDPAGEHADEDLCGQSPGLHMIACGPEDFCWEAVGRWVETHPLRQWESVEVLKRDPVVVENGHRRSCAYRAPESPPT
jgi:hypothetical protein